MLQTQENKSDKFALKANQLPFVVNNATMGHKLQGSGVDKLFVHSWSYVQNWVYVMLSRVTTMEGLFLHRRLSRDLRKYAVPDEYQRFVRLMQHWAPLYPAEHEYNSILTS